MRIGICLSSLELSVRAGIAEARRLGVRGVQLDAQGDLLPNRLTATGQRELRVLLRSNDLELTALNCPLRHGLDYTPDQDARLQYVRDIMTLAVELGTANVIVPLPRVPNENAGARGVVLRDSLVDLGRHADRIGARLALEMGLDAGATVNDFLASLPVAGLAINYDPANLLTHGYDPVANLTPLTGRIVHTHARDARLANVSQGLTEVALGAGDIDWLRYVALLGASGYTGFLTIERSGGSDRRGDVGRSVPFLKRLLPAFG